jgi:hypothetical protein
MSAQDSAVPVKFIHFGLIDLAKDSGFVAGGFSRVYFGSYKSQQIALKMLYVMDLTPESISQFCEEARMLHQLRHENVIQCLGVSIMPPAVSIVLEFCKYGSLFDFLYKPRTSGRKSVFIPSMRLSASDTSSPLADNRGTNGSMGRNSFLAELPQKGVRSSDTARFMQDDADVNSLHEYAMKRSFMQWESISKVVLESGERSSAYSMHSASAQDSMFSLSSFMKTSSPITEDLSLHEVLRTDVSPWFLDNLPMAHSLTVIGRLQIMRDIARGLTHLHSKQYMHCDIKSLNFLITEVRF